MKNNLRSIRERIGVSQDELATAIGVSQGNISHCECDRQELMPDIARRLIVFAQAKGLSITFDDVYDTSSSAQHDTNHKEAA